MIDPNRTSSQKCYLCTSLGDLVKKLINKLRKIIYFVGLFPTLQWSAVKINLKKNKEKIQISKFQISHFIQSHYKLKRNRALQNLDLKPNTSCVSLCSPK